MIKVYKISIQDINTGEEMVIHATQQTVRDMMCHENMSTPIIDAKTNKSITIKDSVFDKLGIENEAAN